VTDINRRQFLMYALGAAGAVILARKAFASAGKGNAAIAVPGEKPAPSKVKSTPGKLYFDGQSTPGALENFQPALVIDAGACIGCRRCMYGCREENNQPDSISPPWTQVFQMEDAIALTGHASQETLVEGATTNYTVSPTEGYWYLATQCNHCENAPCTKVCPTGATYKDKDGYVLMDYQKCVGCRFCVVACPYNARRFNWVAPKLDPANINPAVPVRSVGVVEKCTFCVHRTRAGRLPRCVEVCPVGARHFGNLLDPQSEVSRLLAMEKSLRLLEELNTGPHIYYITRGKKYLG
jgi:molybdopterin-containing oxidoreductase family iron-sulfur binding subunit